MSYQLVITEKPSVAMSYAKVLGVTNRKDGYLEGNGYLVSWCIGHLVELAPPNAYGEQYVKWSIADLPILPQWWKYLVSASTKKQFAVLKSLMNRPDVDSIICATDAGREGELIFRLVYQQVGCKKPFSRLWLSSMEDSAIREGFANLKPSTEYDALYQAALCRERADWMVGINASRLFSCLYGQPLAVGRVMTPVLAMTVVREAAITAFVPQKFYTVELELTSGCTASSRRISEKDAAENLLAECRKEMSSTIQTVTRKEKSENPPLLYDLTTLQRDANRLLGYSAQQTLNYVQSLYEKKLTTYPRTDSCYITDDDEEMLAELADELEEFLSIAADTADSAVPRTRRTVNRDMLEVEVERYPMTKKTMREYNLFIRSVLNYANDNYGMALQMSTIKASGRKGKSVDCLHSDEVEALQAALQECSMLEKAIILCLLNTGVRRGELAGLTWKDVNFREGTIHVSKSLLVFPNYGYQLTTTKESNIRDVDVAPEFMDFLKDYYAQWKAQKKLMGASWQKNLEKKSSKYAQSLLDLCGNDFMICNDYGFPINPDSYGALVNRVGRKAGIEKIHPHMFRHTFVSILLSNPNIGVATVAAEAGRAQPSTTLAIYTQVYDRRRDEIRKQMSKELYK